jgi:hypothetical protein
MAFQWDQSVLGQSWATALQEHQGECRLDAIIAIVRPARSRAAPSDLQAWTVEAWRLSGPSAYDRPSKLPENALADSPRAIACHAAAQRRPPLRLVLDHSDGCPGTAPHGHSPPSSRPARSYFQYASLAPL